MNCYYVRVVECLKVAPRKLKKTTVAVNFSNSTLGNSDRKYTIILFISNIILPTILMTYRGGVIILCRILAPRNAPPPSPDATILFFFFFFNRKNLFMKEKLNKKET